MAGIRAAGSDGASAGGESAEVMYLFEVMEDNRSVVPEKMLKEAFVESQTELGKRLDDARISKDFAGATKDDAVWTALGAGHTEPVRLIKTRDKAAQTHYCQKCYKLPDAGGQRCCGEWEHGKRGNANYVLNLRMWKNPHFVPHAVAAAAPPVDTGL
jgi:hypothetical protein